MTTTAAPARRILLRSSWATVNIGDVAHSPGAAAVLHEADPEARITLWAMRLNDRERAMFAERQPWLEIVEGRFDEHDVASTPELARAWEEADLLVHGSGSGLVAGRDMYRWQRTGRPYGVFGITYDPFGLLTPSTLAQARAQIEALPGDYMYERDRELFAGAAFLYCRDSLSRDYLAGQGTGAPCLEWGPDATFAYDLSDDGAAAALIAELDVRPGFLVAVPRSRYAPYHRIYNRVPEQLDHYKVAVNAAHDEQDMAVLASAITSWVRRTGQDVLIGPEMSYAVQLAAEHFPRILPSDVAPRVRVLAEYWDLPTATAVYRQAAAVLSMDCHSPILATAVGTPSLYLRQPTETIKGVMFGDLGAPERVVEIEAHDAAERLADGLAELVADGGRPARELTARMREQAQSRLVQMAHRAVSAAGRPGVVERPVPTALGRV
ncbi:polysaccharide pyruvyl transferase family protein [Ruania alkalisoli]|uniref:Polysaccharide pyruvyl transferase family protein n=1 Tax=Ruania alkalisoli TaxID=2779775 RepID=A0A7M1SSX7_9MICO|nr:polysaccharide pyruvyl transferase family protein [Ruania alkalisoli]QOR69892.1 polysaccharide pyruvyl transferase family protein [Ruania alkalisoli]